jgi:hypothetical protein
LEEVIAAGKDGDAQIQWSAEDGRACLGLYPVLITLKISSLLFLFGSLIAQHAMSPSA